MVVSYWHENSDHIFMLPLDRQLYGIEPRRVIKNRAFSNLGDIDELNYAFLPRDMAELFGVAPKKIFEGHLEGNRSTTLSRLITLNDREFAINIKGSSSRILNPDTGALCMLDLETKLREKITKEGFVDVISDECITRNRPYGGQRYDWGREALNLSDGSLGIPICPVISLQVLPKESILHYMGEANPTGESLAVAQEIRLMPSNVRINPDIGMRRLCLDYIAEADRKNFVEKLLASAFDIITLPIRTIKRERQGVSYFKFDEVDVAKDGVIARDGTMHFADLEGILRQQDTDDWHGRCKAAELAFQHVNFFVKEAYRILGYRSREELLLMNLDLLGEHIPSSFSLGHYNGAITLMPV